METGVDLQAPDSVRRLQTALHAKAKGDPAFRFYTLSSTTRCGERTCCARRGGAVRRNGGACGVDGETFEHIKEQGADRWRPKELRELPAARGAAGADPEEAARHRASGTESAAMLVLTPIFEGTCKRSNTPIGEAGARGGASRASAGELGPAGDPDLSNYFGEIPHAELMRSIARRVSDGRVLGWVKVAGNGRGGSRAAGVARIVRAGRGKGHRKAPRSAVQ